MTLTPAKLDELKETARHLRIDVLKMLTLAGSGHTGGSLSAVDIITALYFHKMRHDPQNPRWDERDRFILSKGHGGPALYAALSKAGYFDRRHLWQLRQAGGILQGHPFSRSTPGLECTSGSLGQGLSIANGIALACKLTKKSCQIYVLLGDGEIQEGQVWEAAMSAAHHKLDNICAIVDNNGLQIDGSVDGIKSLNPIAPRWRAFGWETREIDGHDLKQIIQALDPADKVKGKPQMIVAHTIKGKGVSFMEGKVGYHGVAPTREELKRALPELGASIEAESLL